MEQAFKVGDRVECISGYDSSTCGTRTGWTGTIRAFDGISAIVTWDGKGARSRAHDLCNVECIRVIEAPPSLEDRIAALEARLAALEGPKEEVKEESPQYKFGDPVEVYVDGEWRDGVVASNKIRCASTWVAHLHELEPMGFDVAAFEPKYIRPRTT